VSASTLAENEPVKPPVTITPLSGNAVALCEKCGAPLGGRSTSICKRCGWYAIARTYVEIDASWEGEQQPQSAARPEGLPRWAWLAVAAVVAVILESTAVRCTTPDGSYLRAAWSGAQFLLGLVAFFGAQVIGFVILMREDATAGVLDVILKPFKVSAMLFRELPKRAWIVIGGISGLTATLAAVVIIGSVPYHALWSWTVDYRSQQGLADAIAKQGSAGGDATAGEKPQQRKTITCVIVGYELNESGTIRSILAAREVNGRLQYVGGVAPTGEAAQLFELREKLLAAPSRGPILPMTFNSNWVLPKFTCEISYGTEQENKNLTDLRWEGDVREMRMPGE
jgi:hypothetical protein